MFLKELKASIKNSDTKNWLAPNCSLAHEEFLEGIQKAENNTFHSVQDSMKHFESWLKSKEKM